MDDQYVTNATNLYFGVMRNLALNPSPDFAVLCSLEHALEDGFLSGFTQVSPVWLDTQSTSEGGTRAALCMEKAGIEAALGLFSTAETTGAALVGNIYEKNMVAMSEHEYSAEYVTQIYGAMEVEIASLAQFCFNMDWLKVAIIVSSGDPEMDIALSEFTVQSMQLGIELSQFSLPASASTQSIESVLEAVDASGYRIILPLLTDLAELLQVASDLGMLSEGWGWIATGRTLEKPLSSFGASVMSTEEVQQYKTLLQGFIALIPSLDVGGTTYERWQTCVESNFNATSGNFSNIGTSLTSNTTEQTYSAGLSLALDSYNGYFYDSVQLVIRALDASSDPSDPSVIRQAILNTAFTGVTGDVSIDENGHRTRSSFAIRNVQNGVLVDVGRFFVSNGTTVLNNEAELKFPGNMSSVPSDYVMTCNVDDDYITTATTCVDSVRNVSYSFASNVSARYCPELSTTEEDCNMYSVCDDCTDYVQDRICVEDLIDEDIYETTTDSIYLGILRDFEGSVGIDMSAMCALDNIVNNGTVISNSTSLNLIWLGTGSTMSGGISAGNCMRKSGMHLAVAPSAGSTPTSGAALIGTAYQQNLIGTTATSPSLSDATTYSYFSRVIASDSYQGSLLANYSLSNNWTHVATLSLSPNTYFDGIITAFGDRATELGIAVTSYTLQDGYTESQISEALRKIRATGIRIVLLAVKSPRAILVEANSTGMLEEGWGWLSTEATMMVLDDDVWGLSDDEKEDLDTLLEGFIGLVPAMAPNGTTYAEWHACIDEHFDDVVGKYANIGATLLNASNGDRDAAITIAKTRWNGFYYDAIQVALRAMGSLTPAQRLDPTLVRSAIRAVSYYGTSGLIQMDSDGDRSSAVYEVGNIYGSQYNSIGRYENNQFDITSTTYFPGLSTEVPVDYTMDCTLSTEYNQTVSDCEGSTRLVTYVQNSDESKEYCPDVDPFEVDCDYAVASGVGLPLAIAGFLFTTVATVFLLIFWNHKIIRLSQREFLLLMMFGAYVGLTGPIVALGKLTDAKCATLPSLAALGYVLLFGPLFVKTWRVSVLVRNTKLRKIKLPNSRLYRRLFALVAATGIMIAVMMAVDPPHVTTDNLSVTDSDGVAHLVPYTTCSVNAGTMSLLLILLLAIMTLYGCFVSYQIRHVESELSEAKWIFISVYNGAVMSLLTLAVILSLDLSYASMHAFGSIGILVTCMMTITLILVPKLNNIRVNASINTTAPTAGTQQVAPSTNATLVKSEDYILTSTNG